MQDAEDERVRLENERIAAEEKEREDEKERRRKAKQEKKDAQVAAGTYMTKAEKENAKKQHARLDAMKAAGMQIPAAATDPAAAAKVKATDIYKKPAANNNKPKASAPVVVEEPEVVTPTAPSPTPAAEAEVADDWDADDDWEANLEQIQLNLEVRTEQASEDVEDRIVVEKRKEQEKLRLLGIERAKREAGLRLKK